MGSTFGSLSIALSALYTQRRALDVTGQNIANVNTDGYSRQRVAMAALGAPVMAAMYAVGDPTAGGVEITDITRMRDEFLEARGRAEHASNAYLDGQQQIYTRIEQVIGEPSDTGLQSQFSEFWSAWHDLANRPGDSAARTQVLQRAQTVTSGIRDAYSGLASLWDTTREQLDANVTEVNQTAATIAQLNEAIIRASNAELSVNELADQRDQAVLRLCELTGGSALTRPDGSVDVSISGSSLVSGATARQLATAGATRLEDQATDPVGLRWADTGTTASVTSGHVASALETLNTTLPGVAVSLDAVASALATTVNTQHVLGFDLAGVAGVDFFTGTTAATLAVAITDPALIAASADATTVLDGSNADAIAGLNTAATGPDRIYRQFVVDLGVAAQTVNRRAGIQSVIKEDVDAARMAQSGVNLDEEMTNMIAYQRAYEAAAKTMATIDATLETLINGLRR